MSQNRILNAEALTTHGHIAGRETMVRILEAGLQAADPYNRVVQMVRREGNVLTVGGRDFVLPGDPVTHEEQIDLDDVDRVLVFGIGKGIQRAVKGLEDVLGDRLSGGHVIDKQGCEITLERLPVTLGAHPVPDEQCVEGCRRILELTRGLTERDLVFTVIGNGVSSLLTLPAEGLELEDVREVTRLLQIEMGAPTNELNQVRNHLDQLKGARIARHIHPARAIHILTGGTLDYGTVMDRNIWQHTMPERSTFADAENVLKRWNAWDAVAPSIREHLLSADPAEETVKRAEYDGYRFRVFEAMPPHLGMIPAARREAERLGLPARVLYRYTHFEAAPAAAMAGSIALNIEEWGEPFEPPCVLLGCHELLVTVGRGDGMGGRNQEWALAAAKRIAGSRNIIMGSVDSDGNDGPGHQFVQGNRDVPQLAGGIVDGETWSKAMQAGWDVEAELKRHNTSPVLWAAGDGVQTTFSISVGDLTAILILGRAAPRTHP
ncbi:MAG: glycerate kinase type-2 family protein [Anaerolineae bacterium]